MNSKRALNDETVGCGNQKPNPILSFEMEYLTDGGIDKMDFSNKPLIVFMLSVQTVTECVIFLNT